MQASVDDGKLALSIVLPIALFMLCVCVLCVLAAVIVFFKRRRNVVQRLLKVLPVN